MPAGNTLVWGTANPEGLQNSYRGVYLNQDDVKGMVDQVNEANVAGNPIPVKLEHTGLALGRVLSAWESKGSLECLLELNESILEGSIGAQFVRSGLCKDLSLGYTIDMEQSKGGKFQSRKKRLNEISVVVKGARQNCKVRGVGSMSSKGSTPY